MSRTVTVAGRRRPVENGGVALVPVRSLDALANTARHEIGLTQSHAIKAVEHALAAGDALQEAKDRMPHGQWGRWLEDENIAAGTAAMYMRVARYRDAVVGRVSTIEEAKEFLRDSGLRITASYGPDLTYEIEKLKSGGLSDREVARRLKISYKTVAKRMRDPETGTRKIGGHNRKRFEITAEMIEGMAVWLCKRERRTLDDTARAMATDALRAAASYAP